MATNYGSDTICVSDVPLIDLQTSDPFLVIGQRIARRLQTPRGGLAAINDDPGFGLDVRLFLNGKLSQSQLSQIKGQIESECLKDEEVQSATATLTYTFNGPLIISLQLVAAPGPFILTMNVTTLTVNAVFSF